MCCSQWWMTIGAVLAGLAVATGALAAHGLGDKDGYLVRKYAGEEREVAGVKMPAAQKYLADFKTGAEYQMYHALALLAVGLLAASRPSTSLTVAGIAFFVGILLFSGFLYLLVLTGQRWMGAIVPIGGVAFLVGWVALAIAACPCGQKPADVHQIAPRAG